MQRLAARLRQDQAIRESRAFIMKPASSTTQFTIPEPFHFNEGANKVNLCMLMETGLFLGSTDVLNLRPNLPGKKEPKEEGAPGETAEWLLEGVHVQAKNQCGCNQGASSETAGCWNRLARLRAAECPSSFGLILLLHSIAHLHQNLLVVCWSGGQWVGWKIHSLRAHQMGTYRWV